MEVDIFQVDAFTDLAFKGNPAAVCKLKAWPEDDILQKIAAENNLSETAFFSGEGASYKLRWFTPETEIDLCGHATLATAFVIFKFYNNDFKVLEFSTMSGILKVAKDNDLLKMTFPSRPGVPCNINDEIIKALGITPIEAYKSRDYLFILESENDVINANPDMELIKGLDTFGIIISAASNKYDFVSRYFAPAEGIPEDPVTGSSHCTLIPYWAEKLSKNKMTAKQESKRGGILHCNYNGSSVEISGKAVLYLQGKIFI